MNIYFQNSGSSNHPSVGSNNEDMTFGTDNTERMRIDDDGRVIVGSSSHIGGAQFVVMGGNINTYGVIALGNKVTNPSQNATFASFRLNSGSSGTRRGAEINFTADGNWTDGSSHPTRMTFGTTPTNGTGTSERVRITADGDLLFGNYLAGGTNQPRVFFLSQDGNFPDQANQLGLRISNGYSDASIRAYGSSSSWDHVKFYSTHLSGGTITTAGRITMSGGNTIAYNTTSDYRLKENEVLISDGITRLKQLKPYRFNWKTDTSKKVDGFYAHEVSGIVPEAISGEKDAVVTQAMIDAGEIDEAIGTPVYQGIDQAKLVPLLTAALQEEITKREALETRIAALEAA